MYVRLGSTNRPAGPDLIAEIRRPARNVFFDEQPCPEINSEAIDFRAASELFAPASRPLTPPSGGRSASSRSTGGVVSVVRALGGRPRYWLKWGRATRVVLARLMRFVRTTAHLRGRR